MEGTLSGVLWAIEASQGNPATRVTKRARGWEEAAPTPTSSLPVPVCHTLIARGGAASDKRNTFCMHFIVEDWKDSRHGHAVLYRPVTYTSPRGGGMAEQQGRRQGGKGLGRKAGARVAGPAPKDQGKARKGQGTYTQAENFGR